MLAEPLARKELHARLWNELMAELTERGELTEAKSSWAAGRADSIIASYEKEGMIEVGEMVSLTKVGRDVLKAEEIDYEEERRECYV